MGIGGNFDTLARARREGSYSCERGGEVENIFISVLASLGLNTYPRDKGGKGWDGARRRFGPRGSCGILRTRLTAMKLKLGTHLDRVAI